MKIDINDIHSKNFYELMDKNLEILIKIIKTLKQHDQHKKTLYRHKKNINNIYSNKINFNDCLYIKSENMYYFTIIALSIIWSFNETEKINFTNKSFSNFFQNESYQLINETKIFLKNYKIWWISVLNINIEENFDDKELNSIIFKIYSILQHAGIIEKQTYYVTWLNKKKSYYICNNFKSTKILKIYTTPFKHSYRTEIFSVLLGNHYSLSWDMLIPNTYSGALFNLKEKEVVINMIDIYTNIDFEQLKELYNFFLKENEIDALNLNYSYNLIINEFKNAVRQSDKQIISKIGKKISIYQKAILLYDILNQNYSQETKFYLPWKYDFRGRTYFFSEISFTFHKEFRLCMYTGYYKKLEDFIPKWHFYNNKIFKILDTVVEKINLLNLNIKNNDIFIKYNIIWLLISLAEINKTNLGYEVKLENFIKEGIRMFNSINDIENYEYEEKIKIKSIYNCIKEFENDVNLGLHKKRLISKDAPASVFQHLVLNFGWKDDNALKWCNLFSENIWYDTYTYFINEWKRQTNVSDEKIIRFFNRKTLKKIIMTANYGVGYESAEEYYKEITFEMSVKDKKAHEFLEENWNEIKTLFEDFFNFLSTWNILEKSPLEISEYVKKEKGIIELIDASIDANYYFKNDAYTTDFLNEGKRYTKYFTVLSNEVDENKFTISIRANYIQGLDSALTRWVIKRHPIYTIHDCFLIDYANTTYLISLINEGMNQKFHDFYKTWQKEETEIFSIFILL